MIYTGIAHARSALVGNPSDIYNGKTISYLIGNFSATVSLWESPYFEIQPSEGDLGRFDSMADFLRHTRLYGYYGGMRLIKAAVKRLHDHFIKAGSPLPHREFTISFHSDIPRLVGLSGSSAIIAATMRAMLSFYGVTVDRHDLVNLIWSAERDELGLACGPQDRVVQVYGGMVYMDFRKDLMQSRGYGEYVRLRPANPLPLYVAYDPDRAEISDIPHSNLRARFVQGDPKVLDAIDRLRGLTDAARDAIATMDLGLLGRLINENFDIRRAVMHIAPENSRMVDAARKTGASAHFCGSGGAITGLYDSESHYAKLEKAMAELGCSVLRPQVAEADQS